MTLSRDQKITALIAIITIGFVASVYFFYARGVLLYYTAPLNTFLPVTDFGDFYGPVTAWHDTHFSGIGFGNSYFPAAYLLIDPFSRIASIRHGSRLALLLFEVLVFGFLFVWSSKSLRSKIPSETLKRAFACTFMTYPALFTMITGNFEGLLFVCLALFAIFYHSGRTTLSLPFLGLAIGMKLAPAVFCVLFLADKKYRPLCYLALWVVFFTLLPLLVFPGGLWDGPLLYLHNLQASQRLYYNLMVVNEPGVHFGHSMLNFARVISNQSAALSASLLQTYLLLTLIFFAGIALYVVRFERVFWKRVALLVCAACLLPYTSTDYKLLHFFIPLFFFINDNEPEKFDLLYVVLFGLLLIPKNYLRLYHHNYYDTNIVLNAGAMIVMVATIMVSGLARSFSRSSAANPSSNLFSPDVTHAQNS